METNWGPLKYFITRLFTLGCSFGLDLKYVFPSKRIKESLTNIETYGIINVKVI